MTLAIESSALLPGSSAPPRRGMVRGASRSHYALQPTETLGLSAWLLGATSVKENRPPSPCDAVGAMLALLSVFMDLPAAVLEPGRTLGFRLIVALAILIIGWLAAKLAKGLVFRFLLTARFDIASERAGIDDVLVQADIRQSPAELVAVLVSWLILLATLVAGVSALGLSQVSDVLTRFLDYAP